MMASNTLSVRHGGRSALWFILGVLVTLFLVAAVLPVLLVTHRTVLPGEAAFGGIGISAASALGADRSLAPVPTSSDALAQGRLTFTRMCGACHGQNGEGNGPNAANVFPPPRNLTEGQAKALTDGQLVWIVENGLSYTAMPSYKGALNRDRVLELVGYIRALQNGTAGAVPVITPAPQPRPGT
jgi:mono/diheme cytochrome c family protein